MRSWMALATLIVAPTRTSALQLSRPALLPGGRIRWRRAMLCMDESLPQLPDKLEARSQQTRSLEVDGETVSLDELGPIVIKEDGRLGRLSNWQDMTEGEQQATLKFVAKRNAKRRKALLKAQSEAG